MDLHDFRKSLAAEAAPPELSPPLRALWHAGRSEWDVAHRIVQDEPSEDAAWVHAHLHRIEGDMANADYWYRQAGRTCPPGGTNEELWDIAAALLRRGQGG